MSEDKKKSVFDELDKMNPSAATDVYLDDDDNEEQANVTAGPTEEELEWLKLAPKTMKDLEDAYKRESKAFLSLLASTELPDQTKVLWSQTYDNILQDRKDAYIAWLDLYKQVHGHPDRHAVHGDHVNKYLERREKANAQLLKLAELAHNIKEREEIAKLPTAANLYQKHKIAK